MGLAHLASWYCRQALPEITRQAPLPPLLRRARYARGADTAPRVEQLDLDDERARCNVQYPDEPNVDVRLACLHHPLPIREREDVNGFPSAARWAGYPLSCG